MRLLLDEQFPAHLGHWLRSIGVDAIHIADLKIGLGSADTLVVEAADQQGRVLVTRDKGIMHRHRLHRKPAALVHVVEGNCTNRELRQMFADHLHHLQSVVRYAGLIELNRAGATLLLANR